MNYAIKSESTAYLFERVVEQNQVNDSFIACYGEESIANPIIKDIKIMGQLDKYKHFKQDNLLNCHGLIRDTNFLNVFFIVLLNSEIQNQIYLLQELLYIIQMDSKNTRTLVELGYAHFLL